MPLGEVSRERGKFENLLSVGSHQKTLAVSAADTSAQLVVWTSDTSTQLAKETFDSVNRRKKKKKKKKKIFLSKEMSENFRILDCRHVESQRKINPTRRKDLVVLIVDASA